MLSMSNTLRSDPEPLAILERSLPSQDQVESDEQEKVRTLVKSLYVSNGLSGKFFLPM